MLNVQYAHQIKKGDSVQFENKMYRVQEDKGWLYIYPMVNGKRTKIDIDRLFFKPGTEADWVFNEWWKIYDEYDQFRTFAAAELAWVS